METEFMDTILTFASVPLRKMGTDLLGSWLQCDSHGIGTLLIGTILEFA